MTSHYQQQLAAQLRAAEDELGQRRRQVAELTEQRDTAQAAARERADILEHARDLLEPWGGHGDAWPDIAPAIETLIARAEQAEARITAARALHQPTEFVESWTCAECSRESLVAPEWPCPTIRALDGDTVSTDSTPGPAVTLRTIGHWRPVCSGCKQLTHPGMDCVRAAERRAMYEETMAAVVERFDQESSCHLGAAFTCDHGFRTTPAGSMQEIAACGPDCDSGHMYDGRCRVDPHLGGIIGRSTDPQHPGWYWSCEGGELTCEGWLSLDHASAAAAHRSFDRHVARDHRALEAGLCRCGHAPVKHADDACRACAADGLEVLCKHPYLGRP